MCLKRIFRDDFFISEKLIFSRVCAKNFSCFENADFVLLFYILSLFKRKFTVKTRVLSAHFLTFDKGLWDFVFLWLLDCLFCAIYDRSQLPV